MSTANEREKLSQAWFGSQKWWGHFRIRAVKCGKKQCGTCPHAYYAYYTRERYGKKIEQYLGKCTPEGMPINK